jgi:hypothetical protein
MPTRFGAELTMSVPDRSASAVPGLKIKLGAYAPKPQA